MNLILLNSESRKQRLERDDRRAIHIRKVLSGGGLDRLFVGVPNGKMGRATASINESGEVALEVDWDESFNSRSTSYPLVVLVGLPRPQTCRKILRQVASLGVDKLVFFASNKGEAGYQSSSLWKTDEWQKQLMEGVEQAFSTHVPKIVHYSDLKEAIDKTVLLEDKCFALDNYEATRLLGNDRSSGAIPRVVLAIGSERGWSSQEREILRSRRFELLSMGQKVMRTETAMIAACSIVCASFGFYE